MRCVALFPLGNMQHFQEGFNHLSQTLFWTRVTEKSDCVVVQALSRLAEVANTQEEAGVCR
jgi:hypothetical protein